MWGRKTNLVNAKENISCSFLGQNVLRAYTGAWAEMMCKTRQTQSSIGVQNPKEHCLRTEAMQMRAGTVLPCSPTGERPANS
jgi:hypothetical protein